MTVIRSTDGGSAYHCLRLSTNSASSGNGAGGCLPSALSSTSAMNVTPSLSTLAVYRTSAGRACSSAWMTFSTAACASATFSSLILARTINTVIPCFLLAAEPPPPVTAGGGAVQGG